MAETQQLEEAILVIDPDGELGETARTLLPCLRTLEASSRQAALDALAKEDRRVVAAILALRVTDDGLMVGGAGVEGVFDALSKAGVPRTRGFGIGELPVKIGKPSQRRARAGRLVLTEGGISRKSLLDLLLSGGVSDKALAEAGVSEAELDEVAA